MNAIARFALYAGLTCSFPVLAQPAGGRAAPTLEKPTMMQLTQRLQPLFERTKAVCFTRFVIDIPASATVVYGRMTIDTELSRYAGRAGELEKQIEEFMHENRRRASAYAREGDDPAEWGGKRLPGKMPGLTHLLSKEGSSQYFLHSLLILNDDIYLLEALGFFEKHIQEAIADHESVARHLQARKDEDMPTEEGICIDGAFANLRPPFENIQIGIRLAEFPDVHFSIETKKNQAYVKPQQDFLDRYASAERTARKEGKGKLYDRIKFFSREARTVLEWRGHQVLARVPAMRGGHDRHEFKFYSNGEINDPFHPEIDIELETGVKDNKKAGQPPSLTDAEALALWDKLLGSIRVRPVAAPAVVKPLAVLGMKAEAGPCPQAGWWKCLDAEHYDGAVEVKGGQLRYFHDGVSMPQAVLQSRSSWAKLFGEGKTFQMAQPSQWQLVDRRWTVRPLQPNSEARVIVAGSGGAGTVESTPAPGAKCACGMPSPASGWWGCKDVDAVEPSRWFAQGETTPDIRYRANLHWWQRLAGQPAVVARKTAWQLLRAEERSAPIALADATLPGAE